MSNEIMSKNRLKSVQNKYTYMQKAVQIKFHYLFEIKFDQSLTGPHFVLNASLYYRNGLNDFELSCI